MDKRVLFFCFPFLLFPLSGQETLRLVTESWPPFRIVDEEASWGYYGIDIDVLEELENRLNVVIDVQRHPWARGLNMLKNGQADMIIGLAYTEERAGFVDYVPTSYFSVQPVFYTQKGRGSEFRTYQDLAGHSIGMSIDSAYFEPFNSDSSLNKVTLVTEPQIIEMLALGRLDLAVGTNPNIAYDIYLLGLQDKVEMTAYIPPVRTDLYIAFSKLSNKRTHLEAVDRAIRDMLADGTIDAIAARYR